MLSLNVLRTITFFAGFLPSILLCVLASALMVELFHYQSISNALEFILGLGAFAVALGFALSIFVTFKFPKLTVLLLIYGVLSIAWLLYFSASNKSISGMAISLVILVLAVTNIQVMLKNANSPNNKLNSDAQNSRADYLHR